MSITQSDEHKIIRVPNARKIYHCGTLTYTKIGLFAIFAWLLWGDFCITLMELVVPSILPLKLKSLGCSNWMMGVILSTIPNILNITICPYVSFKSDRYRSRWGRRIPFIICTMPFLCISLALLGWSDEICTLLQKYSFALNEYASATVTIALIAFFMAMFQFFNMFVNSVFWYLFNDVVPAQFLGRFLGSLRIISTIAAAFYNYFIFKYAESHMREIFLGASILYFVGLGLTCLMVKEGQYPPLEGEQDKDSKGWGGIKTFLRECFTHKFYWILFASAAFLSAGGAIGTFGIFFNQEMGMSLDDIGKYSAITGIASLLAVYFSAIFVDRWHPLRVIVYLRVFAVIGAFSGWIWLFVTLPGKYYFWLCIGSGLIAAFQSALGAAADFPMIMRLFPKSRFGQFCSARALTQAFLAMVGGISAGLFIDAMKWFCKGTDFAYRFNFIWSTVFGIIGAVLSLWLYIYWYKLGGDKNYHPPAPWSPEQREEMEIIPSVPPQSRWLQWSFCMFNAIMALSVLGLPVLMWWMYHQCSMITLKWFIVLIVPLSVATWILWKFMEKGIRSDMESAISGKPLKNGIPHHGLLMVISIKYLIALSLWAIQIVVAVNLKMETGAVIFGIANVVTNFMLIGCVWLLCRVERGFSTTLNEKLQMET